MRCTASRTHCSVSIRKIRPGELIANAIFDLLFGRVLHAGKMKCRGNRWTQYFRAGKLAAGRSANPLEKGPVIPCSTVTSMYESSKPERQDEVAIRNHRRKET